MYYILIQIWCKLTAIPGGQCFGSGGGETVFAGDTASFLEGRDEGEALAVLVVGSHGALLAFTVLLTIANVTD